GGHPISTLGMTECGKCGNVRLGRRYVGRPGRADGCGPWSPTTDRPNVARSPASHHRQYPNPAFAKGAPKGAKGAPKGAPCNSLTCEESKGAREHTRRLSAPFDSKGAREREIWKTAPLLSSQVTAFQPAPLLLPCCSLRSCHVHPRVDTLRNWWVAYAESSRNRPTPSWSTPATTSPVRRSS